MVLAGDGGALPRLVLGLRFGVGAIMGSGRQWMSWIHIDDVLRIIETTLSTQSLRGPINCTAPFPVRHEHFMREAARGLGRSLLVERRLYVRDSRGRLHAGVDAGVRLLSELKPYRRLAGIFRLPGFYALATLIYEGIHAPALMRFSAKRRARRST